MKQTLIFICTTATTLATAGLAHAHGGHGLPGSSHWHASDTWGYVVLASLAALALLWWRSRK